MKEKVTLNLLLIKVIKSGIESVNVKEEIYLHNLFVFALKMETL